MSNYSLWIYLLIYFLLLATLYVMKSVLKVILITIMTTSKMLLFLRLSWKLRNLKNNLQLSSSENNHSTKNRFLTLTELTFKKYVNIWISLQNYIIFSHYMCVCVCVCVCVCSKLPSTTYANSTGFRKNYGNICICITLLWH